MEASKAKRKAPRGADLDADTSLALAEYFKTAGDLKIRISYKRRELQISGSRRQDVTRIPLH